LNYLSEVNVIVPVISQDVNFQCHLLWSSLFMLGALR
jgi:hypothetical protein